MHMRYAVCRKTGDRFPVEFRDNCERTPFDPITGRDESLVEVIARLHAAGYQLEDKAEGDES